MKMDGSFRLKKGQKVNLTLFSMTWPVVIELLLTGLIST